VPKAGKERELPHELFQRAFMRDDRFAREPTARPFILHSLYSAARAFPKQSDHVQHTIGPNNARTGTGGDIAAVSRHVLVGPQGQRSGRRRWGSFHAMHELPQIAQGYDLRHGTWGDR